MMIFYMAATGNQELHNPKALNLLEPLSKKDLKREHNYGTF